MQLTKGNENETEPQQKALKTKSKFEATENVITAMKNRKSNKT